MLLLLLSWDQSRSLRVKLRSTMGQRALAEVLQTREPRVCVKRVPRRRLQPSRVRMRRDAHGKAPRLRGSGRDN